MSLSNSVRTHLIDPTVDNSSRTRFRLPDGFLASSIKLIDVGLYDAQQTAATGLYYPSVNGVLGAIRRLNLYSGNHKLDTVEELRAYGSYQSLLTSNQGSEDLNRFEQLNGMGLSILNPLYGQANSLSGSWTLQSREKDYHNQYANNSPHLHNQVKIASSADHQESGSLLLSNYLQFLASTPVLPMIPDLQLEIEWDLTAGAMIEDAGAVTPIAAPVYAHTRPTLVVDEILGVDKSQAQNVNIPYFQTIVERFVVPSTTNGTEQSVSFRSSAFKNRYVKDLTFFNQVTTNDGWFNKNERSPSMYRESLQLVVNGSKYLPDQGINHEAMKLQYFTDTHGSLNLPLASALQSIEDASGNVLATADSANANSASNKLAHNYSVTAIKIDDTIDRLDIEYKRVGNNALGSAQARVDNVGQFNLLCFGRVSKMLQISNGKIRDSY
jgi:hypothetical protein